MKATADKKMKPKARKETQEKVSGQIGLFFDQTRCDACYSCCVACKDWNDVPPGPASWLRVSTVQKGKFPDLFMAFNIERCYHCVNAPCAAACPAEAIRKREKDGIVVVDREKCVGKDKCGRPCSYECPAGNDVLGFVSLMKEGKYAEAWRLLIESNPFPGITGRVCSHPCESACSRNQVDEPLAIQLLERFAAEHMHTIRPFTVDWRNQKVAVVGSGPAGLSCAYHLAKCGYRVTIFEALPVVGGMLRVGIPEYRLPKEVLERELAFIESVGVEIHTNMQLGKNLSIEDLGRFDGVFLAVGAHKERPLNIPGINLKGVITGLDFLKGVRLNNRADIGKRVVVLGGGNVAVDCARTAHRLGAAEIHVICPECCEEMLASPSETEQGKEEDIIIHNSCLPSRILGLNDHVVGAECISLRSMKIDENGKLHFDAIEGSEKVLAADTVILAIGQEPDLSFLPKDIKVHRKIIGIDEDGATSRPIYFAGGDAAIPTRKVAWAIGSGRRAANVIDQSLRGRPKAKSSEQPKVEFKLLDTDFIRKEGRVKAPMLPVCDRCDGFAEVEQGLDSQQATAEANRCLRCEGMCLVACPYDVPQFDSEHNPKMQKCDFCLQEWEEGKQPICVRSCTMRAMDAGPVEELKAKYGDVKEAEGFSYYKKSDPAIFFKPKTDFNNK